MAVADADYGFVVVDVGAQGKHSDGSIFANSIFGKRLKKDMLDLPPPGLLPGTNERLPYAFVADEAFALHKHIMKLYSGRDLSRPEKVFNYRLSRARRIVENAFGIMASRFRLLRRPLLVNPKTVDVFVLACTFLHNYLRKKASLCYMDSYAIDYEDNNGNVLPGH